jgi:hypothetical protein
MLEGGIAPSSVQLGDVKLRREAALQEAFAADEAIARGVPPDLPSLAGCEQLWAGNMP